MNDTKILSDDPKLTAYALGELEGGELAAVEAAVRADPALQSAVAEIRALAGQLTAALEAEPVEAAVAVQTPRARQEKSKGKLLQFPQLYFVIGGLAAACFAMVFTLQKGELEMRGAKVQKMREEQDAKFAKEFKDGFAARAQQQVAVAMPVAADASNDPVTLSAFSVAPRAPGVALGGAGGKLKQETFLFADRQSPVAAGKFKTEAYAYQRENDFLGAAQNPLSTFSIDVDTASYANVRRFLQQGVRPPADAVRIEELVNYFPYRYQAPKRGGGTAPTSESSTAESVPFAASMEVAQAPWAPEHRLVRIGLKGREVSAAERGPANLVFLLDVSGSMNEPNKLPLVKESMRLLVGKLRPDDRVAIVVYAGASGLALPSTPVKRSVEILAALDGLTPGGSTNGAMGIELAYDIAKANLVAGGINRVVLCTDGDFNVGVTSEGELTRLIGEKAKSGVFLTVLGFGMGNYKDATLEKLADKGNGNYGYIDTRREAEKLLVEQVNGTLMTIAKDVKIQVEFNPAQVASYRLIGYENRMLQKEDFNNDKVDAGEIGAGHTVTALYEVVPVGKAEGLKAEGLKAEVDALKYQAVEITNAKSQTPNSGELLTLKVRYKEVDGSAGRPGAVALPEVSKKLEFPLTDGGAKFAAASSDFRFAAAVAGFGMVLRDSPHKGTVTLKDVAAWARAATDDDVGGYRGEFVELVERAEAVMQ
jgi:Ca-activated chloride channel family protein